MREDLEPQVEYIYRPLSIDSYYDEPDVRQKNETMFTTYHQRLLYKFPGSKNIVKKG